MKIHLLRLVLFLSLTSGCGRPTSFKWEEGGLYSTQTENGSYSVLKVLKIDDNGVHIRLYSNQFEEPPLDVAVNQLYMAGVDRSPNETLGVGHMPISKQSFQSWDAVYIKTVPVANDELEGYEMWLEAEGGYF